MPKTKTKKIRDHASDLADMIAPTVESARDKAAPALSDARDRLTNDVLPVITAAIAAASEATEDVRGESKKRGKAAVAALRGEVEAPKKRHRFRKMLLVLGLGGVAAAVAKKLSDRPATTAWQSSYSPTPSAPAGAHKGSDAAADQGGASPDVAAADAASAPHAATTPDSPVETIDVSKN